MSTPLERWKQNPFFLLGLAPSATDLEIERQGRMLLGQLELGLASARAVVTPLGKLERTADDVRMAMRELEDLRRRALHARWASLAPTPAPIGATPVSVADASVPQAPWPDAFDAIGWQGL